MGDVVTALARAVQDEGHRVSVVIPKYDCLDYSEVRLTSQLPAIYLTCLLKLFSLCQLLDKRI